MIGPVRPSAGALRPLGLDAVRITGGFWGERQERNAKASIPHAHHWLEETGWLGNFRLAATDDLVPHRRRGREFSDSEVFKLAEAMAWECARGGDVSVGELSTVVAAAQEPGGYLNTMFGRPGQQPRYSDLTWGHELYCYGHLIQAGVARLRGGVKDALATTAIRAADHVCVEFGPTGRQALCGHPGIEMALVELFRATGTARYLDQARLFVDRRGQASLPDVELGRAYFQDDVPVRERVVFAGHAVRALYLACGAVDVAVETGDDKLLAAVVRQWERTVAARTYVTGGMGSRHEGEAFGEDFELPADRAYVETCAAVASVMLCWRLLLATGEARFADLAERTLFNVVAASTSLDGRAFFYTNPLRQRVAGEVLDRSRPWPRASSGERAPWRDVSCCPTNVARTLASLGGYVATVDDGGVQVHQYAAGTVASGDIALTVATGYPWDGGVEVRVDRTSQRPWRLSLRVPAWAGEATLVTPEGTQRVTPGYAVVSRTWRSGDTVRLELPLTPRWTAPDPRIDAVRGCVAVERGPLVYCAESVDHDPATALDAVNVDRSAPLTERPLPALGRDVVALAVPASATSDPRSEATRTDEADDRDPSEPAGGVPARTTPAAGDGWPYGSISTAEAEPGNLTLVPYHLWANRGPATMRVWLPVASSTQDRR
ncbi:glycoside hydrolase family 127 protein [Phytohabitans sp. LJ34]|uniref:glycoside hydrolase family 127 protein n=1 Tax=Phytohabitans sp. LJ34 TaxID=3452217 RepID=UPI003F88CC73